VKLVNAIMFAKISGGQLPGLPVPGCCPALYINDLPKVSRFRTTMFADDTLLTISSNNPQPLNTLANAEQQKIDNWMRINKLSLNYKKQLRKTASFFT